MLIVNVLVSLAVISNHSPLASSVALGYAWLVALLSLAQVNVIDESFSFTRVPT